MPTPAHFPPLCDYIVVNDSSPGTQVWSTTAGAFVAYNNAGYLSWLSGLFAGDPSTFASSYQILGATSASGGAATSLQVTDTGLFTNGQAFNVQRTGLYDGNQTITVLDATHFTIPVAFAGNATGWLAGPSFIATAALLNNSLRAAGLTLIPTTSGFYSVNTVTVTSGPVTLVNPMTAVTVLQGTPGASFVLKLPAANQPNSISQGLPFCILNQTDSACQVESSSGSTALVQVPVNGAVWLAFNSNSSIDGQTTVLGGFAAGGTGSALNYLPQAFGGLGDVFQVGDGSLVSFPSHFGMIVTTAAFTAPRNVPLAAANSYPAGAKVFFIDLAGGVSATNTWSAVPHGTDTINGVNASTVVVNHARGWACLVSDGGSKWSSVDASDAFVGMSGDATATRAGAVTVNKLQGQSVTPGGGWTPSDQSGAGLTFTSVSTEYDQIGNRVFVSAEFTYPTTADGSTNKIGGLPVPVPNKGYTDLSITACGISGYGLPSTMLLNKGASTFQLQINNAGSFATNAQLSGSTIRVNFNYPAT